MTSEAATTMIRQLCQAILERAEHHYHPIKLFLCAEVVPGMVTKALYQDQGSSLKWLLAGIDTSQIIEKLWYSADKDKIWRGIYAEVTDQSFKIDFDFPDYPYPPNTDDDDEEAGIAEMDAQTDRMMAAVKARFGDKPIIYPTDEEVSQQLMRDAAVRRAEFDLEPPSSY